MAVLAGSATVLGLAPVIMHRQTFGQQRKPELVRYANTLLRDRVLFGTDYPLLTPDRWLADIEATDLAADAMPAIMRDNAVRLLGLGASPNAAPAAHGEDPR